jgi:hypothetical protein
MEQRHDYKRNKGYHKGANRILMRNKKCRNYGTRQKGTKAIVK